MTSKDSDQPGHPPSLISNFAVHSLGSFLHADSEDSDQTGQIPRLIWGFAGHTVVGFFMLRLKYTWCCPYILIECSTLITNSSWSMSAGQTYKMTCAARKDSDQPGNPPTLIRIFIVCFMGPIPSSEVQERLVGWEDAQVDRWSESLLGAEVNLLVLSCLSSIINVN